MTHDKNTRAPKAKPTPNLGAQLGIAAAVVALLAAAFFAGRLSKPSAPRSAAAPDAEAQTVYYCSMHPHIRKPAPGLCDICAMDLVVLEDERDLGPRRLEISDDAAARAEIETAKVRRQRVQKTLHLVGKIDFDETRVHTITARVGGRLDRLYVDYTGIVVKRGDHLAEIYSPELLVAQTELIEAHRGVTTQTENATPAAVELARETLAAAREKLRLWGLTPEQIADIEKRGTPSDHLDIFAPSGGVVVEKLATAGDYVQTGTPLYRIGDISRLWANLEAYESDLAWLHYGQDVEFESQAFPGEVFVGKIRFIDWVVDPKTRTTSARVNVENAKNRLKPGMFVRARVFASLGVGGQVMAPELTGKWISPMHPEIVKDGPGACDVCGMALVPAEELFQAGSAAASPLVIPASAPLVTGRRAVVYVKLPDAETPTYEGREIVLGPQAAEHYVVVEGLVEGDEVVVRGSFRIDSALQIKAKSSMMRPTQPDTDTLERFEAPTSFLNGLTALRDIYFALGTALAGDDLAAARPLFEQFRSTLEELRSNALPPTSREAWEEWRTPTLAATQATAITGLPEARAAFRAVSRLVLRSVHHFELRGDAPVYEAFCPMAFDGEGDAWLQRTKNIENPYFGASMFRCGELRGEFVPERRAAAETSPPVEEPAQPDAATEPTAEEAR